MAVTTLLGQEGVTKREGTRRDKEREKIEEINEKQRENTTPGVWPGKSIKDVQKAGERVWTVRERSRSKVDDVRQERGRVENTKCLGAEKK